MNRKETVEYRKANMVEHVVRVIHSCINQEQLKVAESYALRAGLRLNDIVNEALKTRIEIFKIWKA